MSKLDHFRASFERAVVRSKDKKVTQHVQHSVQIEKAGDKFTPAKSKTTTFKLSEEQYRTSIIAKAIAYINKHKGAI